MNSFLNYILILFLIVLLHLLGYCYYQDLSEVFYVAIHNGFFAEEPMHIFSADNVMNLITFPIQKLSNLTHLNFHLYFLIFCQALYLLNYSILLQSNRNDKLLKYILLNFLLVFIFVYDIILIHSNKTAIHLLISGYFVSITTNKYRILSFLSLMLGVLIKYEMVLIMVPLFILFHILYKMILVRLLFISNFFIIIIFGLVFFSTTVNFDNMDKEYRYYHEIINTFDLDQELGSNNLKLKKSAIENFYFNDALLTPYALKKDNFKTTKRLSIELIFESDWYPKIRKGILVFAFNIKKYAYILILSVLMTIFFTYTYRKKFLLRTCIFYSLFFIFFLGITIFMKFENRVFLPVFIGFTIIINVYIIKISNAGLKITLFTSLLLLNVLQYNYQYRFLIHRQTQLHDFKLLLNKKYKDKIVSWDLFTYPWFLNNTKNVLIKFEKGRVISLNCGVLYLNKDYKQYMFNTFATNEVNSIIKREIYFVSNDKFMRFFCNYYNYYYGNSFKFILLDSIDVISLDANKYGIYQLVKSEELSIN